MIDVSTQVRRAVTGAALGGAAAAGPLLAGGSTLQTLAVAGVAVGVSVTPALLREVFWIRTLGAPSRLLRAVRRQELGARRSEALLRLLLDAHGETVAARARADAGRRKAGSEENSTSRPVD